MIVIIDCVICIHDDLLKLMRVGI